MSMTIKYENPWRYNKKVFESTDINEYYGFVYRIINKINGREYIGRKYFWQFRTPKGKTVSYTHLTLPTIYSV